MMTWTRTDVTVAQRLLAKERSAQWALADLLARIFPTDTVGIDRFADEVGMTPDSAKRYRKTALAWPESERVEGAAFGTHTAFRNDRREMSNRIASGERLTVDHRPRRLVQDSVMSDEDRRRFSVDMVLSYLRSIPYLTDEEAVALTTAVERLLPSRLAAVPERPSFWKRLVA